MVFSDPSGYRTRAVHGTMLAFGLLLAGALLGLIGAVVAEPRLPEPTPGLGVGRQLLPEASMRWAAAHE